MNAADGADRSECIASRCIWCLPQSLFIQSDHSGMIHQCQSADACVQRAGSEVLHLSVPSNSEWWREHRVGSGRRSSEVKLHRFEHPSHRLENYHGHPNCRGQSGRRTPGVGIGPPLRQTFLRVSRCGQWWVGSSH